MSRVAVPFSGALQRILAVPRRVWTRETATALADRLTLALRKPNGTQSLRYHQGLLLAEGRAVGGTFGALPVSAGKTLVSWLMPTMVQATKPLLVTQGSLITSGKTQRDFDALAEHWVEPPAEITMASYQWLATEAGAEYLEREQFDCVMLDEGHRARKFERSCAKRIERYRAGRIDRQQRISIHFWTGTIYRKGPADIAHALAWSLGEYSPLPYPGTQALRDWCAALDWKAPLGRRLWPGAIVELGRAWLPPEKFEQIRRSLPTMDPERALTLARLCLQRWMRETPGVVIVDESSCDQPLHLKFRMLPFDAELEELFHQFRATDRTPDGWLMPDALTRYSHETELQCGYYNEMDPRPPTEWAEARRAAATYVRETIRRTAKSTHPLDTERQVFRHRSHVPAIADWIAIRDAFKPKSKPVWLSASVLHWAAAWLRENAPALVWVTHTALGEMLSRLSGVPYYASEGRSESGRSIVDVDPPESAILSAHALREGFNLPQWSRGLVLGWLQPADQCEQLIGRQHRDGAKGPVSIDIAVLSGATLRAFYSAYSEAMQVAEAMGQNQQKLLKANIDTSELIGYETLASQQSRYVYKHIEES